MQLKKHTKKNLGYTRLRGYFERKIRWGQAKPVGYKTSRGIIIAAFIILAAYFLIWANLVKPKWLKIEISNCDVALLSAGITYLFLRLQLVKSRVVKFIFGFLWLLLLPNTAYLFTDLGHISYQWAHMSLSGSISLLVQYLLMELFAVTIFLYSCRPFEKIVERINVSRKKRVLWLILFNFLVAYGMVLGRFQHINSWILFSDPLKVLKSALNIFVSPNLLWQTLLFGILCNGLYFLWIAIRRIV